MNGVAMTTEDRDRVTVQLLIGILLIDIACLGLLVWHIWGHLR